MFKSVLDVAPPPPPTMIERRRSLQHLALLWSMVWKSGRLLVVLAIGARLLRAVSTVALLYIPKLVIDQIVELSSHRSFGHRRLWELVALEALIAICSDVVGRGGGLAESILGERFTHRSSETLMRHVAKLDLATIEDSLFFDSLERARNQCSSRIGLFLAILNLTQDGLVLAFLSCTLMVTMPWLLVFLVLSVVPSFVGEQHLARLGYSNSYVHTGQRRVLDYMRFLGATFQTAKEVRTLNLGEHLAIAYREVSSDIARSNERVFRRRAGITSALTMLSICAYYGAYLFLVVRTADAVMSLGGFTLLAGVFARSRSSIERISTNLSDLLEEALRLSDLFTVLSTQASVTAVEMARPFPRPIKEGFLFRDVSFSYPGSEHKVLDHVNLEIRVGERIALVGTNGAGKTTLVKLLLRLYEPTCGSILLDGVDLREYRPEDIRANCGILFQDFVKYDLSVRDNIGFGNLARRHDDALLTEAIVQAGAEDLVGRFDAGFSQLLGRRFKGSVGLSGGEWQKIALARVHASDGALLICDEPTASLDAEAEHKVFTRLLALGQGRTTVVISHRFSTTRNADKIVVLSNGTVVEEGNHQQLMLRDGRYAELFRLQTAGYV